MSNAGASILRGMLLTLQRTGAYAQPRTLKREQHTKLLIFLGISKRQDLLLGC